MKCRSTIDSLYIYRTLIEKAKKEDNLLGAVHLDCNKAFDSIDRILLYNQLLKLNISSDIINIIISMHTNSVAAIRINNNLTQDFRQITGVKQGSVLGSIM